MGDETPADPSEVVYPNVGFVEEADNALSSLESNPAREHLLQRVNTILQALNDDPTRADLRRRRFQEPPLWAVEVSGDGEDWAILWAAHPDQAGGTVVYYLGPASFQ